jgi:hypothetical protein
VNRDGQRVIVDDDGLETRLAAEENGGAPTGEADTTRGDADDEDGGAVSFWASLLSPAERKTILRPTDAEGVVAPPITGNSSGGLGDSDIRPMPKSGSEPIRGASLHRVLSYVLDAFDFAAVPSAVPLQAAAAAASAPSAAASSIEQRWRGVLPEPVSASALRRAVPKSILEPLNHSRIASIDEAIRVASERGLIRGPHLGRIFLTPRGYCYHVAFAAPLLAQRVARLTELEVAVATATAAAAFGGNESSDGGAGGGFWAQVVREGVDADVNVPVIPNANTYYAGDALDDETAEDEEEESEEGGVPWEGDAAAATRDDVADAEAALEYETADAVSEFLRRGRRALRQQRMQWFDDEFD